MRHLLLALGLPAVLACGNDECTSGASKCSEDGFVLSTCEDGSWKTTQCLTDRGQLCESGACVDPWKFGNPAWPTCANDAHDAGVPLHEKAEHYDDVSARIHVHPDLKWMMGVTLREGATEATATFEDVETWHSGENDGLWSALYLASQGFRYAATRSPEALAMIKVLLEGEVTRMKVTGVPGIFTRQFIPPGIDGLRCPEDLGRYRPDAEKDDNQWVKIGEDGCALVVETSTDAWKKTDHCISPDFKGYCWLDNVSKDEYSGHMFALGVLYKLVDDPEVQATVVDLLTQVGRHFTQEDLKFRDWDGRITEHGRLHAYTLDGFPGFHAAMSMDFVLMSAVASGDAELRRVYDECLVMSKGPVDCFDTGFVDVVPFLEHLDDPGMYIGRDSCGGNWNNISMHLLSLHNLIWFETDPIRRYLLQTSFDTAVMRREGVKRRIIDQHNALFDFIWAAHKRLGPGSDGPDTSAVEDGICMLRQFRTSERPVAVEISPEHNAPYCKDRFNEDSGEFPKEIYERCVSNFVWWGDPYDLLMCVERPRELSAPADYLLPYWMGRYYGFISPEL